MKHLKIYIMALICMGMFSCEKRHIDDNLYNSSVYIINSGLQTEKLYNVEGKNHTFTINTYCGGFYDGDAQVRLVYNQAGVLDAFNEENGTAYELLPENCYKLDSRHKVMEDNKVSFEVTFDCDKIAALSEKTDYSDINGRFVIPYTIVSETEGIDDPRYENIKTVFINIEMNPMSFKLVAPKASEITFDEEYFYLTYKLQAVVENKWESEYEFVHNFDTKFGVGNYTLTSSAEKFTPGVSEIVYDLKVLREELEDFLYEIQVTVNKVEDGFSISGDATATIALEPYPLYDRSGMTLISCNSAQFSPMTILDGDTDTKWEGAWTGGAFMDETRTPPYWAVFKFPEAVNIKGFGITRRQDSFVRDLKEGYVEFSMDGVTWEKGMEFDFGDTDSKDTFWFKNIDNKVITAAYIKFVMTKGHRNNSVGLTELNIRIKE